MRYYKKIAAVWPKAELSGSIRTARPDREAHAPLSGLAVYSAKPIEAYGIIRSIYSDFSAILA